MGIFMGLLFFEQDEVLVKEIAKLHNVDEEIVRKHYKTMLEGISDEIQHKA